MNSKILVAHNVRGARTGGMSRIMGFTHDPLAAEGFTVDYFCSEDAGPAAQGFLARFRFGLSVARKARKAYQAGSPYSIINIHEPDAAMVVALRRFAGNPNIVVTTHGVEQRSWDLALEELRLGRAGPSVKTRIVFPSTRLWQANYALRKAQHIFCLNEEDRNYIHSRFRQPLKSITRIFPGADQGYYEANQTRDYSRFSRILFSGTWRKNKGIEDMVPAFVELAASNPGLCLQILGSGVSETTVLRDFPSDLHSRIVVSKSSNESENIETYRAADAFVLPSLFEGTPLVLMEAMMSGLPIVTTNTCGMKDVIQSGQNGLLVDIRSPQQLVSALQRLATDVSLREQLGKAAQQEAIKKYTWNNVATIVRDAYKAFQLDEQSKYENA